MFQTSETWQPRTPSERCPRLRHHSTRRRAVSATTKARWSLMSGVFHAHSHRAHTTTGHRYLACAAPCEPKTQARRSPRPRPAEHLIPDGTLLNGIMFSAPSPRHPTQAGNQGRPAARPRWTTLATPRKNGIAILLRPHTHFTWSVRQRSGECDKRSWLSDARTSAKQTPPNAQQHDKPRQAHTVKF